MNGQFRFGGGRRLVERVAEDKALQKAMMEMMKRMPDVETALHFDDLIMSNLQFTVEQFRALALDRFGFLEAKGFHRAPSLEETSPTGGTVVYLGKHVGFIFSLDVRDQCVDAQVVKVLGGQMRRNWEGGYSSDIFGHLVTCQGYRGNPSGSVRRFPTEAGESALQHMIDGWVELLKQAGQSLMSDRPDSLPR